MARSSYVYTVNNIEGDLLGGFTVKHELASWLEHRIGHREVVVWRIRDGLHHHELAVELDPFTLKPIGS